MDDVIARSKLLEHSADRVCHVDLGIQGIPGADASTPLLAGDETVPVTIRSWVVVVVVDSDLPRAFPLTSIPHSV